MSAAKARFSTAMDTARVGACFMVVILHVAAVRFATFDDQWWASNFYDSLARSCVPLFLMITGVLLLGKQESLPAFLSKRFARILPPLLFWSLFYMAWNTLQGERYGLWYDWLRTLAHGPVVFHLWYLYAIVGIYLFVPFLRAIWNAARPSEKIAYLALWAAASTWPTLGSALGIDTGLLQVYGLDTFFGLAGYLFLGAYVHEAYTQRKEKRRYWYANVLLFIVFSTMTMVATYVLTAQTGVPATLFYDYLSPFVMASAVCAFNVLYGLGTKASDYAGPLKKLSACTLGVYCLHIFVLNEVDSALEGMGAAGSSWWSIPATAVAVFSISLGLIMLLRRFKPFELVT